MLDREDDGVVGAVGVHILDQTKAVFVFHLVIVGMWIVGQGRDPVGTQFLMDVDDSGVADVRNILLEGPTEDQDPGTLHGVLGGDEVFDRLLGYVFAHRVVDASAGEDHFGVVAQALRLEGQVVWVHSDAMATDQSGAEGEEIPLGSSGLQDGEGVDSLAVKDQRELIHQGNVEVTLGVLDHLGRLGGLDAGGNMNASSDDGSVDLCHQSCGLRGIARDDLLDLLDSVLLVPRVDPLGRVAGEEVRPPFQATLLLDQGQAIHLGASRIDGGLADDRGARLDVPADHLARLHEEGQVGSPMGVDRGGHRHNDEAGLGQDAGIGGEPDRNPAELVRGQLLGTVMAVRELANAGGDDVEAHHIELGGKGDCDRQAHIAKADDADRNPFGAKLLKLEVSSH